MYGPNYVKLSRVFAARLFSMIIEHYAALPPVRSDPHWSHSHAIIASIRLALTHTLQHTLLATQTSNLDSGNHDMSRLSTLAYLNDSPIHGLSDIPLRLLPTGIGCGALDPRTRRDTATHAARDSNLGSGNHDMSRLSALAYLNDSPIHGLTDIPLAHFQRILGVAPSILAVAETRQHTLLATQTSTVVTTTCLDYLHSHT